MLPPHQLEREEGATARVAEERLEFATPHQLERGKTPSQRSKDKSLSMKTLQPYQLEHEKGTIAAIKGQELRQKEV